MPVPVPKQSRLPAHLVVKPQLLAQNNLPFTSAEHFPSNNALQHVIHNSPFQPSPFVGRKEESESLRKLASQSGSESQIALSGSDKNWPPYKQHSLGCADSRDGLIVAHDATVSKQRCAEACYSPVGGVNLHPTMGQQNYWNCSGSTESIWSGYDADDDVSAKCKAGAAIQTSDTCSSRIDFHSESSAYALHSAVHPSDNTGLNVENSVDKRFHNASTPFANYIDRVVASDATRASDHFILDSQNESQVIETPRRQQPASGEPLTDPSYIKAYRLMAEPLSDWIADYVWKVCTAGMSLQPRFTITGVTKRRYSDRPSTHLAKSVQSLLCSTLLQPSGVVLALWYIARLPVFFEWQMSKVDMLATESDFRDELFGEDQSFTPAGEWGLLEFRVPFRLILLGCMLANKWLDDHTFSNKTWHAISEVPIQSINRLELIALNILNQDLSIPSRAWEQWLNHLCQYHLSLTPFPAPIRRPSAPDANSAIRNMLDDLIKLHGRTENVMSEGTPQPVFSVLFDHVKKKPDVTNTESIDPYEIDLDEDGPLREEYVPKRRVSNGDRAVDSGSQDSASLKAIMHSPGLTHLPPPSEWSPQGDPPMMREHGKRDRYLAVQPHITTGQMTHGRSFSAGFNQCTSRWPSTLTKNLGSFNTHDYQGDMSGLSAINVFRPVVPYGIPLFTAQTNQAFSTPSQGAAHPRAMFPRDDNGFAFPDLPCGSNAGFPPVYSQTFADPAHFRPLWLRT